MVIHHFVLELIHLSCALVHQELLYVNIEALSGTSLDRLPLLLLLDGIIQDILQLRHLSRLSVLPDHLHDYILKHGTQLCCSHSLIIVQETTAWQLDFALQLDAIQRSLGVFTIEYVLLYLQ